MNFEARMQAFIDSVKEKAKDGLSIQEALIVVYDFIQFAVDAAKELANPGVEKKAIVLDWVGKLFDMLAPLVVTVMPKAYWPFVPLVRPINRRLVLLAADAFIEWTLKD